MNWFSLTRKGSDFYINIGKYSFILSLQNNVENHYLKEYFKERRDFVSLEQTAKQLINAYKFSNSLKGSFVIYFDKTGKLFCLMHTYEKGFQPLTDFERIFHLNTKKQLKDNFNHQVYILERI